MKTFEVKQLVKITSKTIFNLEFMGLGITEADNFNRIYFHPKKKNIEVVDVRQNPKNKRVFFVKVKDLKDLSELNSIFDKSLIIEKDKELNEFAVYKYQLSIK